MLLEKSQGTYLVLLSLPPEYSLGEDISKDIMCELQRQPEMKVQTDSSCLQQIE